MRHAPCPSCSCRALAATIVKLVKDYMPSDVRIASETTEMLVACCTGRLVSAFTDFTLTYALQPSHAIPDVQQEGCFAPVCLAPRRVCSASEQ